MKDLLSPKSKSILEVMEMITLNGKGLVFVIDEHEMFLGTISDGDIRRAIISGVSLSTQVEALINKESREFNKLKEKFSTDIVTKITRPSVFAYHDTPVDDLLKLVNERIQIIPLLKNGKVFDYFEHKASFHAPIASPSLKGNEVKYVLECLETNWISSQGRYIPIFEKMIADFCSMKFGTAVSNGTVALHLALMALEIGEGDEVIVPDLTFGATINAVLLANATPVIVDVEPNSWCIDPEKVQAAITSKTKAIIPVHLYGQMANMGKLKEIATKHKLKIIEDCAESLGAFYQNQPSGSFSDVSCFSFFANKVITTGEGGMCLTNSPALDERLKVLRDHGMSKTKRYWHDHVGMNYRMTNIQAAIGVAQVEQIHSFMHRRDEIKSMYEEGFKNNKLFEKQPTLEGVDPITWLVTFTMNPKVNIQRMIELAKERSIDLRPFFYPLSQMPPFKAYRSVACPVSQELSERGLCFPTSLMFSNDEYKKIINDLNQVSEMALK
jgi:perosamine synthetase